MPRLTPGLRLRRAFLRVLARLLIAVTLRITVTGLENFPKQGPALIVINHLGDADLVPLLAILPFSPIEGLGKIELRDHWFVGPVFRFYGIVWIHRGQPDRKAIRAALDALAQGRMVGIAPEGRQSLIGGLEEGNDGAAFLALKSGVPVVPVALTGTENSHIYGHLKRLRRTPVTLVVGKPFFLQEHAVGGTSGRTRGHKTVQEGTRQIMEALASLLPESYRGQYKSGA